MKLSSGILFLVFLGVSVAGSRPCPENCKKNRFLPDCNTFTATCSRGCVTGYYGNTCNLTCDANCEQGTCQQHDGLCICKPGYTFNDGSCDSHKGVICEYNDHCLNNTCLSADRPDCLEGCKPGWFEKFCMQQCSPKCVCHKESGNCTSCIPGWYGLNCGSSCSPGCVDKTCPKCIENVCEMITGECLKGCQSGFYGERCTTSCGKCTDEACNQTTGACTKGCQSGHYGSFCRETCENCLGGECDKDTGDCSNDKGHEWSSVQSWVGGGVAVVILTIIAVVVYVSCRLKRIQGVVYNIEKRRIRLPSAEQDVRPVAAQGYFELEEQVTVNPRRVSAGVPIRHASYIEPRHSGSIVKLQIPPQLQVAGLSDQQEEETQGAAAPPSERLQQKVQRRSDEWSDRPDSYVLPHYCEVNEEGMTTPLGAKAPTSVLEKPVFSVAVGIHTTRGDIRIPPIAECFGPTGTKDSSPDLQSLVENYDHLNSEGIPRIGGAGASRYSQVDDEVRISLERMCQTSTARPDSYIEPRHSACTLTSQQQMLSAGESEQQEDEPQAAVAPPADVQLDDALIAEVPKHAQRAEAPGNETNNSSYSVGADEQTDGGDISITLIAECFGPTEATDSSTDEDSNPFVENYNHLYRDHYMEH